MLPSLRMALGLSDSASGVCRFRWKINWPLPSRTNPRLLSSSQPHRTLNFFRVEQADHHFSFDGPVGWDRKLPLDYSGVTLFSGPKNNRSVAGLEAASLRQVLSLADKYNAPLLMEQTVGVVIQQKPRLSMNRPSPTLLIPLL